MISKDTVEFLRRVGGAGEQARFTGRDALRFVDLRRGGLVDALDVVNEETWPDIIVMSPRVTDAGREELERSRHAVRRWLISHLDTILTATVTAVVISVATAWVTAHFAAAKGMARRTGDAECRDGRNADDGQPLAEAHYTNAVPIATVQQQRAE